MEPITTSIAAKTAVTETGGAVAAKEVSGQLAKGDVQKLASIPVVDSSFLQVNAIVENIPLGERTASFFSASEFSQLEFANLPGVEGIQIRLGGRELVIPLDDGGVLDALGVKNVVQYALSPALDQFVRVRLSELSGTDSLIAPRLDQGKITLPTPLAFAVRASDAGEFLAKLEQETKNLESLQSPRWFEARRIDYLVGNQYVEGQVCKLPIVGGISNWAFKSHLDLAMAGEDWAKLGQDVVMVVSIAAIPAAPVSGWIAMSGWVAANAAFGGVTQGAISYLTDHDQSNALSSAGKGALLGAVGGLAGVAAAVKVAPAIANPLLRATASGATVGSATSATNATIRVIEKGEDPSVAAKEIAMETLIGGVFGGGIGAGSYGVSQIVSKLSTALSPMPETVVAFRANRFKILQQDVEPIIPQDRNLHMGDVRSHNKHLVANVDDFAAHLKTTDPQFAARVDKMASEYSAAVAAKDFGAIQRLETQMKRNLAGELGEALGVATFRPFFDTYSVQRRVMDGATIIDAVFEGAKQPIAIKGHRLVEKGGSLPVEFKAGTAGYFKNEIDSGHLLKQVGGHQEFGKGMVVTTRDVTEPLLATGNAKQILKDAGSTVFRLLPNKADIDAAVARLVREKQ
jgi:hypothetical protein